MNQYLMHHGVKGQKWGVRRYQNPDGTLTDEGKKRYGVNATGLKKHFTPNARETGRRSAIASLKSTAKGQLPYAGLTGVGMAVALASMAPTSLPLAATIAGSAFVGTEGIMSLSGALSGYIEGASLGRQQDTMVRNSVKNGESFVLSKLTAEVTQVGVATPYGRIGSTSLKYHSKKME